MIGIHGRGNIAEHYAKTLEFLGVKFNLLVRNKDHGCFSINSNLIKIYDEINLNDYNKHIIATSTDSHSIVYKKIRKFCSDVPILCEKPFSLNEEDYAIEDDNLRIAMNRRYYRWVDELRGQQVFNKIRTVIVYLPENITKSNNTITKAIFSNSIHLIDLVTYLFQPTKPIETIWKTNKTNISQYQSEKTCVIVHLEKHTKDNYNIKMISNEGHVYFTEPIEILKKIIGFEKSSGVSGRPYSIYSKKTQTIRHELEELKPGFEDMLNNWILDHRSTRLPDLNEAKMVYNYLIRLST